MLATGGGDEVQIFKETEASVKRRAEHKKASKSGGVSGAIKSGVSSAKSRLTRGPAPREEKKEPTSGEEPAREFEATSDPVPNDGFTFDITDTDARSERYYRIDGSKKAERWVRESARLYVSHVGVARPRAEVKKRNRSTS